MAKKKDGTFELPCTFGNASFGDERASIGVKVSRGNLTVTTADKTLTCKRLSMKLIANLNGNGNNGQTSMTPDDCHEMDATADVKGFNASGKRIGFTLSFLLNSIDVGTLAGMAKRDGRLEIQGVEDLPESDEEGED